MPAASWPRCCKACRPSAVSAAASGWPNMPNTPHSSCVLSSSKGRVVSIGLGRSWRCKSLVLKVGSGQRKHQPFSPAATLSASVNAPRLPQGSFLICGDCASIKSKPSRPRKRTTRRPHFAATPSGSVAQRANGSSQNTTCCGLDPRFRGGDG